MIVVLVAAFVIFLILALFEGLWRVKLVRGEVARKMVHISTGSFVAFWPFFMRRRQVLFMTAAFLLVIYMSRHFNALKSIHAVKRKTWGELFFPIGIALVAVIHTTRWAFAAAILHLAVADGLAAIVGQRYGKSNQYKVFGEVKSVAGSAAFLVLSSAILIAAAFYSPAQYRNVALPVMLSIPIIATAIEAVSVRGVDNITVPLFVAVLLTML